MENLKQHVQVPHMSLKDEGLTTIDPLVYANIKRYMNNETKEAFPSMTTLISKTGMTKDTIQKSIKRLANANYLQIKKSVGRSNIYVFNSYKRFEGFSYEFLDMPELTYNDKTYLIITQSHMRETGDHITCTINYDQQKMADILGVSLNTLKKIEKHLQELHILSMEVTNKKELMLANNTYIPSTGFNIYTRIYNFPAFCNEVGMTLKEHNDRINNCEQGLTEVTASIYDLQLEMQRMKEENIRLYQKIEDLEKNKTPIIL